MSREVRRVLNIISEEDYKKECLRLFPNFVKVEGINYKQVAGMTVSGIYEFCYVAFDGKFCDWKQDTLCDFNEKDYSNIFHYVENFLKITSHEVLEEISTKDQLFHRELSSLLNRYNKESEAGNTPDYILASYIVGCLRNLGWTIDNRDKWYKK
jgi:hypothetical protein